MKRPKRPRLTDRMLDGIVAATSSILAGDNDGKGDISKEAYPKVQAADAWAREMREWRAKRRPPRTDDEVSSEIEDIEQAGPWLEIEPGQRHGDLCSCGAPPTWSFNGMFRCDTCVPLDVAAVRRKA